MIEVLERLVEKIYEPLYYENMYKGLVTSIILTLGKDNLDEIEQFCKKYRRYNILLSCIEDAKSPKEKRIFKLNQFIEYKRNETISQLLRWFEDSRSGKRVYARAELKRRFITQSRRDQIRIVKSFLISNCIADREWAALWADRDWSSSFEENLKKALEIRPTRSVVITVINNLPIEYVKDKHDVLREQAALQLCIRLGKDPQFDISVYDLDVFEYLYATAATGRVIDEKDMEMEHIVFTYIYRFLRNDGYSKCLYPVGFFSIPLFAKAIWALGQHGMTETLFSLLNCVNYVFSEGQHIGWEGQFERALTWICREFEIEEDPVVVDEPEERIMEEAPIGDIIASLGPEYHNIYADLGLTPVSVQKDCEDNEGSEKFIENNPFE